LRGISFLEIRLFRTTLVIENWGGGPAKALP
jgi:hypothetical protein